MRNPRLKQFKGTCELGPLGYFLESASTVPELQKYLMAKYPSIDIDRIRSYGKTLNIVKDRRNNAAHGGNIISYQDAQQDKTKVYEAITVGEIKGLIKELLEMLKS